MRLILCLISFNISFAQNFIKHDTVLIQLEKPVKDYKRGDTLRTYDSALKMTMLGVFKSSNLSINLDLIYTDGIRTIEVSGVVIDSNLYWHGKCVLTDFSSKHRVIAFYNMNNMQGVKYYYILDFIQSIDATTMNNQTSIGICTDTGKLGYYWMKDSLGTPNGVDLHFHKNGELKSFGFYKNGNRIGTWFYYDEKGSLVKVERYRKGVLKKTKTKALSKKRKIPQYHK